MGGATVAHQFVEQLPNAELHVVPEAGHAPWMDDPDDVAARIRSFLRAGRDE